MINIENVVTPSPKQWNSLVLGARNPLNSWDRSDSEIKYYGGDCYKGVFEVGHNDLVLMKKLAKAGTDHRKFMRMITVYLDITAPLYWWKEFDTYKVGTVANSCSTMHKIHAKEFTLDDFSHEHLDQAMILVLEEVIFCLNTLRNWHIETKDKEDWYQIIQLLPSSYNQKRTVMLNYEVLYNMYHARKNHKLDEWHTLCDWIETLPYSELITGNEKKGE